MFQDWWPLQSTNPCELGVLKVDSLPRVWMENGLTFNWWQPDFSNYFSYISDIPNYSTVYKNISVTYQEHTHTHIIIYNYIYIHIHTYILWYFIYRFRSIFVRKRPGISILDGSRAQNLAIVMSKMKAQSMCFFMGRLMVINGENRMKNHWKFGRIILISTILRQTHMLEGITDKCLTYEFKTATISVWVSLVGSRCCFGVVQGRISRFLWGF